MTPLEKLIAFIENPNTLEEERDRAISQLNLQGISESKIEEITFDYWSKYFNENLEIILKERIVVISHLLDDKLLNNCFSIVFEEYVQRKKDLGIDVRKYWAP